MIFFLISRAFSVDITNDEAYSFHNMKEFWYAEFFCTGNSHWLNSIWIWICIKLHLTSVFCLRFLSLFAGCTFVGVMAAFSYERTKEWNFGLPLFIITCCNPYVLDYFILARGYSQAILLQALSLFFLFRKSREEKHFLFAILCACGSALAHFSFAYYFLAFIPLFFVQYFRAKRNTKILVSSVILIALTLIFVFLAIRFMGKCSNDFVGAGADTFCEALVSTASKFFSLIGVKMGILCVVGFGITLLAGLSIVHGLFFNKGAKGIYFANSFLLFLMTLLILIAKYLFGSVFPSERSALFLFFPVTINLVFFIENLRVLKKVRFFIFSIASLYFIGTFFYFMDAETVRDYSEQAGSKEVFKDLKEAGAKNVLMCGELYGVYRNYYSLEDETFTFKADKFEDLKKIEGYDHVVLFPPFSIDQKTIGNVNLGPAKKYFPTGVVVMELRKGK
jgi:hypothetical protein